MGEANRSAIERLLAVAASIAQARTRGQVLEVVLGPGIEALEAYVGVVVLIRADGRTIEVLDWSGMAFNEVERFLVMPLDPPETPLAFAARTGESVWVAREESSRLFPTMRVRPQTTALAAVPLVVEGRTIGALGLSFSHAHAVSETQRAYAAVLATLCAQALDRARLDEAEGARARSLEEARAAAEQSEHWYRGLVDAVPPIVWTSSPTGEFEYMSSRWTEYTGESPSRALSLAWEERLHPNDREECLRRWRLAHSSDGTWEMEFRLRGADDRYRWFLGRSVAIRDELGQVVKHVGTATDVDAQKRAADAQRLLSEVGRVLTSSLDVRTTLASVAWLAVPRIADWCWIDARDDGELRRIVVAHADPDDEPRARALMRFAPATRATLDEGSIVLTDLADPRLAEDEGERQAIAALSAERAMIVSLRIRGQSLGAITLLSRSGFSDVDRAVAEELGVRASTAIDNARLYTEAQAANAAKDRFLATISHELRGPLAAINMWSHVLRTGNVDAATQLRALDAIRASASTQSKLIDDLLDLSRSITGKLRVEPEPLDIVRVLRVAVDGARRAAEGKGVALELVTGTCKAVFGDASRTLQIFGNLLSNAVKFTPPGGRVIVSLLEQDDRTARVTVRDTGQGIPPEFLPLVFDPFRQSPSGPTEQGGLGLGLSIARQLVRLQGGTIQASSEGEGKGSMFVVELPIASVAQEGTESISVADNALSGVKILVVDDDDDVREGLALTLSSYGANVNVAPSAEAALRALDSGVPDLLLSDLAMPQMDGLELLRRVRARPPERGGTVVAAALTAYADSASRSRVRAGGFQHHISKSIEPEALVAEIAALVRA